MFERLLAITCIVVAAAACGADGTGTATVETVLAAQIQTAEQSEDVRRVWAEAGDYATPSPDGRYVAFVDWSTGDVAMHDLETGEDIRLTDKGSWADNGSWAEEPLFSPDGSRVVYAYGNTEDRPEREWRYELRMVEVGDPQQHVLYPIGTEDEWIDPLAWSEVHGIATNVVRAEQSELVLIGEDGEARALRRFPSDEASISNAAYSPDERFLAYQRADEVRVLDLESGDENDVDFPVRQLLGWSPAGDMLLVHSAHEAVDGIWALTMEGARFRGRPVLVEAGLPSVLPGGFAGERYFYSVVVEAPRVYRAAVDPATGDVLAEPVALTSAVDGRGGHPAYSPDGASLAYTEAPTHGKGLRFMVMETAGDAVRQIGEIDEPAGALRAMRWAGGDFLVLLLVADDRSPSLYGLDVRSGEVTMMTGPGLGRSALGVSPDGGTVYFLRSSADGTRRNVLAARVLASGDERRMPLPDELEYGAMAISPDGDRAAIVFRSPDWERYGILGVDLRDGRHEELFSMRRPLLQLGRGELVWSEDGRHLLAIRRDREAEGTPEIISVPSDGGEATPVLSASSLAHLSLHPDGRRLAYRSGDVRTELWVLDDLTTAIEAAKKAGSRAEN